MDSKLAALWPGLGERLTRGVVAGIAAGLVFLLLNMARATRSDLPAVAPLLDIATIFNVAERPEATPDNISVGLVTHLTLSAAFGAAFALMTPFLHAPMRLAAGGVLFGIALYVINFQILGRTAFPWFQEGPDQAFELVAHAVFGLLLVPFFVGSPIRAVAGVDGTRPDALSAREGSAGRARAATSRSA